MIKAVVFDLDDTLYPELAYVESGFDKVAKYLERLYNLNGIKKSIIRLFNQDKKDVYGRLLQELGINDQSIIKDMISIYRKNKPESLPFYDDVIDVFETLLKNNIKLGIITDGRVEGQTNKIMALNVKKYIKDIIITDSLGSESFRKPHPLAYEKMKKMLNVDFHEMIYVGDNRNKDFYIKSIYPLTTVEIIRCDGIYDKADYLGGILPDYTISNLQKLIEIV